MHLISMTNIRADANQYPDVNNRSKNTSEDNPEVIEKDIVDQTSEVGSGCEWKGSGPEPQWNNQWNNPKSTKAYDHIERHHGPKLKPSDFQGRVASKNQPQGQWLNSQDWVKAEQVTPKYPGRYIIDFKRPIGNVYDPDGKIIKGVTHALIIRKPDGTLKCGYPILNDTTLSSLERSDQNE